MTLFPTNRLIPRIVLTSCMLAGAMVVPAMAQQPPPADTVIYVDAAKVAEAFAATGSLGKGSDYTASVSVRTAAGQVELHEKETDVFYILDGNATFVTGGKMIDGKLSRPNQYLGASIEGGQEHQLKKGDFIAVPAGTPHWFKQVPTSVRYYNVKSIRP